MAVAAWLPSAVAIAEGRVNMLTAAHVATRLPAQDPNRARRFYAEKLGLEPVDGFVVVTPAIANGLAVPERDGVAAAPSPRSLNYPFGSRHMRHSGGPSSA
jgi:catechol 2,3-dioxygenase-like lactoylglutathione lyase family enzyme